MPVVDFKFAPLRCEDPSTWPQSTDREKLGTGITAYRCFIQAMFSLTQKVYAMKAPAMNSLLLSEIDEEINHNFNFIDVYYVIDPVPYIMKKLTEEKKTFKDDYFNAGSVRLNDVFRYPQVFASSLQFCRFGFGHDHEHFVDKLMVANLAVAAAFKPSHDVMQSSIYPPVFNPYGIYSVRLYLEYERVIKPVYILIDDRIPVRETTSKALNWRDCWFFLVQKAICKLHAFRKGIDTKLDPSVNYSALKNISAAVPMYFGIRFEKTVYYNIDNYDDIWKFLVRILRIENAPFSVTFEKKVFVIIDAAEYKVPKGQTIRLVRWHEPLTYWANYNGMYSWSDEASWRNIPEEVQDNVFEVQRFKVDGRHYTYWTTFDEYLKRSPVVKEMCAVAL